MFLFLMVLFSLCIFTEHSLAKPRPVWEYGLGLGYVQYEQYPASNQTRYLLLPLPTFQYRGEVLRADDRQGARAYLLKSNAWTLEISGTLRPALSTKDNSARAGMDDLPWMIALGPQLVVPISQKFFLKASLFQAVTSDFRDSKAQGFLSEFSAHYSWQNPTWSPSSFEEPIESRSMLEYTIDFGSADFLGLYFDVPATQATAERPAYSSKAGALSQEVSMIESLQSGRGALYFGAGLKDYKISSNRESPLHKSDTNLSVFVGMTYVLGESEKMSIPENQTHGLINQWKKHRMEPSIQ